MKQILITTAIATLPLLGLAPFTATAQSTTTVFSPENAILDTSILFAVGAREARQALRSAFGWEMFQEGLVEGVYFRFDPDGYARFAPTPRLDSDVFEVICRPRTRVCEARKEGLGVFLDSRGRVQLRLEQYIPGDRIFISEGVSELELPERVLQPLDARFEALLSTGGELAVRRENAPVTSASLVGFAAVVAYLRWINAGQDYTVLPRDWPVPNGIAGETITRAPEWTSFTGRDPNPDGRQVALEGARELTTEIEYLRKTLEAQRDDQEPLAEQGAITFDRPSGQISEGFVTDNSAIVDLASRVTRLEYGLADLRTEIERKLQSLELQLRLDGQAGDPVPMPSDTLIPNITDEAIPALSAVETTLGTVPAELSQLAALMDMLQQNNDVNESSVPVSPVKDAMNDRISERLLSIILEELDQPLGSAPPAEQPVQDVEARNSDYQKLSDYLSGLSQGQ